MAHSAVLIDGNSLMYRAFFALPALTDSKGAPTNAVYGFMGMLLKVLSDEQPEYAVVAFDVHGPTFRHERFSDYKGTRAPTPDELRPQFPMIKEILSAMHICILEKQRFEADDLIGTASRVFAESDIPSLIVTGDRDSFQLTGEKVSVLYTKRGITDTERITPAVIMDRYGITPAQLIDMKALCGDTSDNIPGIAGIGEKTAARLIAAYGDLESCLFHADTDEKGKLRERLLGGADTARLCRFLAEIDRNAPVAIDIESTRVHDIADAIPALTAHDLKTLAARLAALNAGYGMPTAEAPAEETEAAYAIADAEETDEKGFRTFIEELSGDDPAAITLSDSAVSCACSSRCAMLPLGGRSLLEPGIDRETALLLLRPLLESSRPKLICRAKELRREAARLGIEINGNVDDPSLAAYVADPQRKSFTAEALAEAEGINVKSGAASLFALDSHYRTVMEKAGTAHILEEIEKPLSSVLYSMEEAGFTADRGVLTELGGMFSDRISILTKEIRQYAGYEINIQSPKQLAVFLYDELGLKNGQRGASARSTSADILEAMADDHPVIDKILEYRKYTKLQGTYIEGLLKLLDTPGGDGRIHTRFDQTGTVTGRLSSLEPNLQNIPVRSELGRDIRRAFIAGPGCVLVDADYSQIELRVLAHMAHDEHMIDAFVSGEDIHRRTAAEIYGVPISEVTPQMRSAAKAVNFGIVYGISEFGLARNTGLTRKEASEFMEMYLKRYPAVGIFMHESVEKARQTGYTETMSGRRRYIRELKDPNRNIRAFGERAAMNSPIQGTAADIIKMAMINTARALTGMKSRLILQVHDELIIEAPAEEAEKAANILKEQMEAVIRLDAPLRADVSTGSNWMECK